MSDISISIKYGKGFEESWAVFKGEVSEVRDDLILYFGVDREVTDVLTLNELVLNVTRQAHAGSTATAALGGVVIGSQKPSTPAPAAPASDEAQGSPWDEPSEPAVSPLFDAITNCADVPSLQKLYAENGTEFAGNDDLLVAWKAAGKALSQAKA